MAEFPSPTFVVILSFILGAIIGSFLNVVIYRLPIILDRQWQQEAALIRNERMPTYPPLSLSFPRSNCPHCGYNIAAIENIPLVSYFFLKGRCRHCNNRISARYPFVELLTASLSAAVVTKYGVTIYSAGCLIFVWALLALSFIDFDTQLLPDTITLPFLWAGVTFNMFTESVPLDESVLGVIVGYLSLWCIYWLFKLLTGKEGMGYGDFKLLGMIGAFLGWKYVFSVVFLSSILGTIVGIYMLLKKREVNSIQIPFGPYLSIGAIVSLFIQRSSFQNLFS